MIFMSFYKGTDEHFGVKNYSDIVTNSIGKAATGVNGGYIFGSSDFITYMRHFNRQYFMSTYKSIGDCASIREVSLCIIFFSSIQ